MTRRAWAKLPAALAAAVLVLGVGMAASAPAQSPGPRMVSGTGTCFTDSAGMCTISHVLGVKPDAVVVSANTPGQYYPFMLNTVRDSYTDKTFKVRAMFAPGQPKANGQIWIAYVASVGIGKPPAPTTAPSTTTAPPTTTATPTTTAPTTTQPTTTTPSTTPTTTTQPPTTPPSGCANPTVIAEQDGRTFPAPGTGGGQYFVHNDAWNWQGSNSGQHELLYLCNYNNWRVDSWGFRSAEGEVFMYPSTKWDATGSCCGGKPLSTWPNQVTGRFAGTVSGYNTGSYNVGWDLWLNGVAGGNYTEMMIWTQRGGNAQPAGSRRADWTAPGGQVYEVWWDGNTYAMAGGSYLAFISKTTQTSGTIDIRAFIAEAASRGYINANPSLNQLNYGIEVRDTGSATSSNPARFTLTDFALTLN